MPGQLWAVPLLAAFAPAGGGPEGREPLAGGLGFVVVLVLGVAELEPVVEVEALAIAAPPPAIAPVTASRATVLVSLLFICR
jgi:hypothetical protein